MRYSVSSKSSTFEPLEKDVLPFIEEEFQRKFDVEPPILIGGLELILPYVHKRVDKEFELRGNHFEEIDKQIRSYQLTNKLLNNKTALYDPFTNRIIINENLITKMGFGKGSLAYLLCEAMQYQINQDHDQLVTFDFGIEGDYEKDFMKRITLTGQRANISQKALKLIYTGRQDEQLLNSMRIYNSEKSELWSEFNLIRNLKKINRKLVNSTEFRYSDLLGEKLEYSSLIFDLENLLKPENMDVLNLKDARKIVEIFTKLKTSRLMRDIAKQYNENLIKQGISNLEIAKKLPNCFNDLGFEFYRM